MSGPDWNELSRLVTCTVLTDDNRFDPPAKAGEKIQLGKFYADAYALAGTVSIDEEPTE